MASISEILVQDDFGRIVSDLCVDTIENREPREYLEEYNGKRNRRTTSVGFREPKTVAVYSETEEELNTQTGKMEPKRLEDKTVPVAKIVTNIPKKIVRTAAAFLFGGDMTITADNTDDASLEDFKKIFVRKLKMKSVLMSFARKVLSETKAAIVFYPVNKVVNGKKVPELKAKILSLSRMITLLMSSIHILTMMMIWMLSFISSQPRLTTLPTSVSKYTPQTKLSQL